MHMTAGGRAAALLQGREGLSGRVQQERLAHRQAGADHAAVVGSVFQQKRWRFYYASQRINRVTAYLILCFFPPNVRARTRRLASKQPRCAADHLLLANALQHSWLQILLCTHSDKLCALYTMRPSPTPNKHDRASRKVLAAQARSNPPPIRQPFAAVARSVHLQASSSG
jgi:hypothetical protein